MLISVQRLPWVICILAVLIVGCRRFGGTSAYDEGVDILFPIEGDVVVQEDAEEPVDPEPEDQPEESEEPEDEAEPNDVVVVESLTPVTNAPLPELVPGVRLDVKVSVGGIEEVTELNRAVSGEGELYLPLIKGVKVEGMTRPEAIEHLTVLYKKYFRDPEVEIIFRGAEDAEAVSPWGYVTVDGRVMSPKRIPLNATRKLMLSDAIALAGGLNTSAKDRSVRVTRKKTGGTFERQIVNLRDIVAGRAEEDIVLQAGDKIYVPETIF